MNKTETQLGIAEIVGGKREAILRLAEKYGAYNVRIFGSVARGEAGADRDVECYIADIPDLYPCSAHGETPDEAVREVLVAKKLWLETAHANDYPTPEARYHPAIYAVRTIIA